MDRILVNASGAKVGGAVTILNSFCKAKQNDSSSYFVIISPFAPDIMPLNSQWVKLETSGLFTLLFALFVSCIYYIKYDCNKIISFSNINTIFPVKERVTYFHNLLICKDKHFKYKLLRFLLRFFNQKNILYIFQTKFVENEFSSSLGLNVKYKVCWPGFDIINNVKTNNIYCDESYFVVPITNLQDEHKNFPLIIDVAKKLYSYNPNIKILVTAEYEKILNDIPPNVFFLGKLSSQDFIALIKESQGVIISSILETVCLPIFESLSFNKPAFVYQADYVTGIIERFDDIDGLYIYNNSLEFITVLNSLHNSDFNFVCEEYKTGDWSF